ncbi:MAG: GNAT family N-acetyltransferase [Candidatus Dormibacteraceae bacterium]
MLEAPDTIETPRLILRQFLEADLNEYARMCADPEVMKYIGDGQPLDRSQTWRSIAGILGHWVLRGYGLWAVEERLTGNLLGRVGLINPEGWPGLEVGWLIDRQRWGEGFATEASREAVAVAFGPLAATHLISLIRPGNDASIRVAEKLGATHERTIEILGGEALVYGYVGPTL